MYLLPTPRDDILIARGSLGVKKKVTLEPELSAWSNCSYAQNGRRNEHPNFKAARPFFSTSSELPQLCITILQVQLESFKC